MSLLDTLSAFFSRPAEETADEAPEGACPNCWGRYEYDGEIREIARDRQIDVNNGAERYAFIQDFGYIRVSQLTNCADEAVS
jgi:hypothetical protein